MENEKLTMEYPTGDVPLQGRTRLSLAKGSPDDEQRLKGRGINRKRRVEQLLRAGHPRVRRRGSSTRTGQRTNKKDQETDSALVQGETAGVTGHRSSDVRKAMSAKNISEEAVRLKAKQESGKPTGKRRVQKRKPSKRVSTTSEKERKESAQGCLQDMVEKRTMTEWDGEIFSLLPLHGPGRRVQITGGKIIILLQNVLRGRRVKRIGEGIRANARRRHRQSAKGQKKKA